MEQPFVLVVGRLQKLLGAASLKLKIRIRFALIGGLAVSAWGAIRATQDIDLLADSEPSPIGSRPVRAKLQNFFQAQDCAVEWRVGEPDDPIPLSLRLNLGGALTQPGADILWAHRRWHQDALQRRLEVKSGRLRLSVLPPGGSYSHEARCRRAARFARCPSVAQLPPAGAEYQTSHENGHTLTTR